MSDGPRAYKFQGGNSKLFTRFQIRSPNLLNAQLKRILRNDFFFVLFKKSVFEKSHYNFFLIIQVNSLFAQISIGNKLKCRGYNVMQAREI